MILYQIYVMYNLILYHTSLLLYNYLWYCVKLRYNMWYFDIRDHYYDFHVHLLQSKGLIKVMLRFGELTLGVVLFKVTKAICPPTTSKARRKFFYCLCAALVKIYFTVLYHHVKIQEMWDAMNAIFFCGSKNVD